jgi:hypothetical protein
LILLAGNQLTLGITLPFVDLVFLLNDISSSDKIIQMMYRCMTESINNEENDKINKGVKKIGFVVDLNISRVLNTCLHFHVEKPLNVEQKITYLVENNLINIDSDLFGNRDNKTNLIKDLLCVWKEDPVNKLKILLKKIEDNIIEISKEHQKSINDYFRSENNKKVNNKKTLFDEEPLPTGIKIIKKDNCAKKELEKKEINISLSKDILPYIIPLICILTINTNHKEILEMLDIIKLNPLLFNVFKNQSFIWWKKSDIISLLEDIVSQYVQNNSCIYNIIIQFKMSLQSVITVFY